MVKQKNHTARNQTYKAHRKNEMMGMKTDVGLFVEGHFRKFNHYSLLVEVVQGAAAMMLEKLEVV